MRPVARTLLLAGVAAVLIAAAGAPGAQGAEQLTCAGTQTNTYTPGLRLLQPRAVTAGVDIALGPCLSATDPTVTSGSVSGTFPASLSCTALLSQSFPTQLTSTFTWSNGHTSTFTYRADTEYVAGTLVVTSVGSIVAGEFTGASATTIAVTTALPTACLTSAGLTEQQGPYTLVFAGA